jgi:toxin-antitoxin system PIN domain toxin
MKALLDVNFLVALAWKNHQFHSAARQWLARHERMGWATCAITQLGFIRLSSQTSIFGEQAKTPEQARLLLTHYTSDKNHIYFSELPSTKDCHELSKIMGPNKVTDAYLVSVARFHHSRFVTFDQRLTSLAPDKNLIEIVLPSIPGE